MMSRRRSNVCFRFFTDTEEVKETAIMYDHAWFQSTMTRMCKKYKLEGYDLEEEKFGDSWKTKF